MTGLTLSAVALLMAIGAPYILTRSSLVPWIDFTNSGPIGDTIGGTAGPFIAFAAAIITFLAFWVEFIANRRQQAQLAKQNAQFHTQLRSDRRQKFEAQFFEMMAMHRENVTSLQIADYKGPVLFEYIYDELRAAFHICTIEAVHERELTYTPVAAKQIFEVAFAAFLLGAENIIYKNRSIFEKYPETFVDKSLESLRQTNRRTDLSLPPIQGLPDTSIKRKYHFFSGRSQELGHYIRHLYATASVLEEEPGLPDADRHRLRRLLPAQLSIYEQVFIYYNGCSSFGMPWITKGLLPLYCKNIIPSLLYFGPQPHEIFGENFKFEWNEVQDRINGAPSA